MFFFFFWGGGYLLRIPLEMKGTIREGSKCNLVLMYVYLCFHCQFGSHFEAAKRG